MAAGVALGSIPVILGGTALYDGTVIFQNRHAIASGVGSLLRRTPVPAPAP